MNSAAAVPPALNAEATTNVALILPKLAGANFVILLDLFAAGHTLVKQDSGATPTEDKTVADQVI